DRWLRSGWRPRWCLWTPCPASPLRHSYTSAYRSFFGLSIFHDFFDSSITFKDTAQAVLTQRHHPELHRLLAQHHRRRLLGDQRANRVTGDQQFENAFASPVARVVAGRTAPPVIKDLVAQVVRRKIQQRQLRFRWLERRPAILANRADQSLTQDRHQRGRNKKRLGAHVNQTRDRAGRIVRVQRA